MATESQRRASAKYDAKNTKKMTFKFNLKTDADVLDRLYSVTSKAGYIKKLIREDIERRSQ